MSNFLTSLIETLARLFRQTDDAGPERPTGGTPIAEEPPEPVETAGDCQVSQVEIPPQVAVSVPLIAQASDVESRFGAQEVFGDPPDCTALIRPGLARVNVRTGPGLNFVPLTEVRGGIGFVLFGASEPDAQGHRWYQVKVGARSGWVRDDLVELSAECAKLTFISPDEIRPDPAPPPPPADRFPPPADVRINQGFSRSHPGLDLNTSVGTPLKTPAEGIVIRRVTCPNCAGARPNIFPCADAIFRSESWGFGYGNFLIIRHEYRHMAARLRDEMDRRGLRDAFAYVLYAHLSRLDVQLGDRLRPGAQFGLTGNHGCSSAPHLHFEVRIGRVDTIDGRWQQQTAIDPRIMFDL